MKAEILTLVTAAMISVSPMSAQAKFQVAEVGQILTNLDQYEGKTMALHGIVGAECILRYAAAGR